MHFLLLERTVTCPHTSSISQQCPTCSSGDWKSAFTRALFWCSNADQFSASALSFTAPDSED